MSDAELSFVDRMWLSHYEKYKTTWWMERPVGYTCNLAEYQAVVLFVLQKHRVDWRAPLSDAQLREAEEVLAGPLADCDHKP